jgi:hypothetical protein
MPRNSHIHITEYAGARHKAFGRTTFFGRAAIVAHAAFYPARGEVVLNGSRRQQGRRAKQVMAAAMAVTVARQRLHFGDAGFLAQAGQCVIFAEDGDHRPIFAGFTDHRSADAGDVFRHPETLQFQYRRVFGARSELRVAQFGRIPDLVAKLLEQFLLCIDQPPDLVGILHDSDLHSKNAVLSILSHARRLLRPRGAPAPSWAYAHHHDRGSCNAAVVVNHNIRPKYPAQAGRALPRQLASSSATAELTRETAQRAPRPGREPGRGPRSRSASSHWCACARRCGRRVPR